MKDAMADLMSAKAPPPWEIKRRKAAAEAARQYEYWSERYMMASTNKLTPAQLDEAREQFHHWNKRYIELREQAP
ncbi:hypothetical protein VSS37_03960 [Candidatus Thiothrix sp. Deng01]|uniref:Uncharacterized protein n=1 Tax=Candidatus Thiothrix phosphatis TaxID=3112415 RepID=A0ABU6CTH0_9GAMM|nr:hypothetical protein [Candidatus Thiothrix sp. Deng01]MEB4590127.1 hypothetical protein [Candidatus Thiothrix sp. Deng01]